MPRTTVTTTNVTAGELSPLLSGRVDLSKYHNSGETITNWIIRTQGALQRRPGTRFIHEIKDSSQKVRLFPFIFSIDQTYVLEFGNNYIRFYKDQGILVIGGGPYEISSPYATADLAQLWMVQSADTLYICHPNYPVYKLQRQDHTDWLLNVLVFNDGPYMDQNTDDNLVLVPSGTTGTITLTAYTKGANELVQNGSFTGTPDSYWHWRPGWSQSGQAAVRTTGLAIAGLSRANPCVINWPAHGLNSGDQVRMSGITQTDWTALNGNTYTITWIDADNISIPVNSCMKPLPICGLSM